RAMERLRNAATTGEIGDGRIFVSELSHVIQIRSGKEDASVDAL
ncbi:MAG: P-II family nitrogen regulator, partial [Alphaproteobacteria bacterium]|nr:P-II family nitrogen regulator [Alphaproteobacteria bacterium]